MQIIAKWMIFCHDFLNITWPLKPNDNDNIATAKQAINLLWQNKITMKGFEQDTEIK